MCLEPGKKVKIDGREVTVLACVNNRMVGESSDGVIVVRDIKFEPPERLLADIDNNAGNIAFVNPPGIPALTSQS